VGDARAEEYLALLLQATDEVQRQLDEVRLPLHILLDNRFGDLNDNQEEMLAAARAAAERADVLVRRLRAIVDLDRGAGPRRRDAIPAVDLLASLLPTLNAVAEAAGVTVTTDVEPALPRIIGDRARLQEAGALLLADRVRRLSPGSRVTLAAAAVGDMLRIDVTHAGPPGTGTDDALAKRIIAAHGGAVSDAAGHTTITLPTLRAAAS
jgi:signal transduction histidine kinase